MRIRCPQCLAANTQDTQEERADVKEPQDGIDAPVAKIVLVGWVWFALGAVVFLIRSVNTHQRWGDAIGCAMIALLGYKLWRYLKGLGL
jgi:hypothetical protein